MSKKKEIGVVFTDDDLVKNEVVFANEDAVDFQEPKAAQKSFGLTSDIGTAIQSDKDDGSRLGYFYNSFLSGIGGMASGFTDALVNLIPEKYLGGTRDEALKQNREQLQPVIRTALKEKAGVEISDSKQSKYEDEFLTSAIGGLAASAPAMTMPFGTGLFAQAYDSGLESINSSEEGKKLPESTKTIFAGSVGTAQAVLEKYGLDKIFGKISTKAAQKIATETMLDLIKKSGGKQITADAFDVALNQSAKTLKQKIIKGGGKIGEAALTEFSTGALQEASTILTEEIVNKKYGEIFEPTSWGEKVGRVLYSGAQEAVGGGVLGAGAAFMPKTRNYIKEKLSTAKTTDDIIALKEELGAKLQEGSISDAELENVNGLVDDYIRVYSKIPSSVSNKGDAADLIMEREELQGQINDGEVDEAFKPQVEQENNAILGRIEEINGQIGSVDETPTENATQSNTALPTNEEIQEVLPIEEVKSSSPTATIQSDDDIRKDIKDSFASFTTEFATTNANTTKLLDRMNNAEYINENEIKNVTDGLYEVLDNIDKKELSAEAKKQLIGKTENLINQLENYEFTTENKTRTVTERTAAKVAKQVERKVSKPALEQNTGEEIVIDGKGGTLTVKDGNYVVETEDGAVVVGEKSLTDNTFKIAEDAFVFDNNDKLVSLNLETKDGKKITIKNPDKALDLAIQIREQEIGSVSDGDFDLVFEEVSKEVSEEVLKGDNKRIAPSGKTDKVGGTVKSESQPVFNEGKKPTETPSKEKQGQLKPLNEKENEQRGDTQSNNREGAPTAKSEGNGVVAKPTNGEVLPDDEKSKKAKSDERIKAAKEKFRIAAKNMNFGGLSALPEFVELVRAYVDAGIIDIKQFIKDFRELAPDAKETDAEIEAAYNLAKKNNVSAIKKSSVSEDEVLKQQINRRSIEEMRERGRKDFEENPIAAKNIVDEINTEARALQPDEVPILIHYKASLDKLYNSTLDSLRAKQSLREDATAEKMKLEEISQSRVEYNQMALKTAYEQSLAFRLRQLMLDDAFNSVKAIDDFTTQFGYISPETAEKFQQLENKYNELKKDFDDYGTKRDKQEEDNIIKAIEEAIKRDAAKGGAKPSRVSKEKRDEFHSLGKEFRSQFNDATRIATLLADEKFRRYLKLGIEISVKDFADFSENLIKDLGEAVRPYLKHLYDEGIKESEVLKKPTMRGKKLIIPEQIIKDIVAGGVRDIQVLTNIIHDMAKADYPELTHRQVRDAITNYGKTITMSQEDIDIAIRQMKRVGKLISIEEDLLKKQRPKRSGLQRDKPTTEELRRTKVIKDLLKDLPEDLEYNKKQWATALEGIKTRLKNRIEDLKAMQAGEYTAVDKRKTPLDKDAKDLQMEVEQLSMMVEGLSHKTLSPQQKIQKSIEQANKRLENLNRRIRNKEYVPRAKESAEMPQSNTLKGINKEIKATQYIISQLADVSGQAELKNIENRKKQITRRITELEQRIKEKSFTPKQKVKPPLDTDGIELQKRLNAISEEYKEEFEKEKYKNRSQSEKNLELLQGIWNIPKGLKATADLSAPLRQGIIMSINHPIIAAKTFIAMHRMAVSERKYKEWLANVKASPEYANMVADKLYISENSAQLKSREEDFAHSLINKAPLFGGIAKGSERAYGFYLNALRVAVYNNMTDGFDLHGFTRESDPELYKNAASFINNMSGRASMGKAESIINYLNNPFFSPRYIASRFNLLWDATGGMLDTSKPMYFRLQRAKYIYSYAAIAVTVQAMIAAAMGDDDDEVTMESDITSSDFGKLKVKDTRYDLLAGFSQVLRMMGQMIFQEKKRADGSFTYFRGDDYNEENALYPLGYFLRSKFSPSLGVLWNQVTGEDLIGNEYDLFKVDDDIPIVPNKESLDLFAPLGIQQIVEFANKNDNQFKTVIDGVAATYGVSIQQYDTKTLTPKEKIKVDILSKKIAKEMMLDVDFSEMDKKEIEKEKEAISKKANRRAMNEIRGN